MYYKKIHIFTGIFLSALLFTSLNCQFHINHYMNHIKIGISKICIDLINLKYITEELLLYLKDDRNDLIILRKLMEVIGSLWRREKEHMVDGRRFIKGRYIRNISLIIFPIMLWMIKDKKGRINHQYIYIYLYYKYYIDYNTIFTNVYQFQ